MRWRMPGMGGPNELIRWSGILMGDAVCGPQVSLMPSAWPMYWFLGAFSGASTSIRPPPRMWLQLRVLKLGSAMKALAMCGQATM